MEECSKGTGCVNSEGRIVLAFAPPMGFKLWNPSGLEDKAQQRQARLPARSQTWWWVGTVGSEIAAWMSPASMPRLFIKFPNQGCCSRAAGRRRQVWSSWDERPGWISRVSRKVTLCSTGRTTPTPSPPGMGDSRAWSSKSHYCLISVRFSPLSS